MKQSLPSFAFSVFQVALLLGASISLAQESTAILKSGMLIGPGLVQYIGQVDETNPHDVPGKQILVVDDGLRKTFVNQNLLQGPMADRATPLQRIETGNAVSSLKASGDHPRIAGVKGAVAVTPFDAFGRRIYSLAVPNGQADVLQGITELSSAFVRVESLKAEKTYIWDMRLALSAVPAQRLREILVNNASPTNPQSWLNIVALFSDAKRFVEARDFLLEAIRRFPELENQRPQVKQFDQLHAQQMFDEVGIRTKARQFKLAEHLLKSFSLDRLSLETKIKIDTKLTEVAETQNKIKTTAESLRSDTAKIANGEFKNQLAPMLDEITRELSMSTILRLSDYIRLRDDPTLSDDQRVATALGGWLFGSGESENNLPVMLSAWQARGLVREYLVSKSAAERDSLLDRLKTMEGGTPRYIAKMIKQLKPPLPLPASETAETGRFVIDVPNSTEPGGMTTKYSIQLPPEYDPNLRYPCIVSLHSQFAGPEALLEWWAGPYSPEFKMCLGEASRYGYIVIAPHWSKPKQPDYFYTEDEHARVLQSLRDAMRRTSIDVDRVFLCGHHLGGDAVWDIALAHPDIWAGAIAFGADCNKYPIHYTPNARYVPLYFVVGELDGSPAPRARNGAYWDEYLKDKRCDCLLTIYHGRGRDHFQEEQPRLMEWMGLSSHTRPPPPQKIDVRTARACDRSFWWLEISELTGENIVNPHLYKPGKAEIEATRAIAPDNGFRVTTFPGKNCVVWLSPETVDFSKRLAISIKDKKKTLDIEPNLRVLLEDVRTRADRQHPYWAKFEF